MKTTILLCLLFVVIKANIPFVIVPSIFIDPKEDHIEKNASAENPLIAPKCGLRDGYFLNRIVAGNAATKGEFPWQVSVQLKGHFVFRHVCGGAIISENFIVTGGHCVYSLVAANLSVVAGDHNLYEFEETEQRRDVEAIFGYNFDLATFGNDIALLKMHRPFVMKRNRRVAAICLPGKNQQFDELATVTGWGRIAENGTSPQLLQKATIPFIPREQCFDKYIKVGLSRLLNECQICAASIAEHRDACQGDSGGPLICSGDGEQYYLCGIVSWGIGCGNTRFPGIYTNVTCFIDWIKETIKN